MRRLVVAVFAGVAILLSGCQAENPQPVPSTPAPIKSPSATATEAPTARPEPVPTTAETPRGEATKPETTPTPKPSATTEAGTPATQFASRWGKKYPDVPEFAILRAANATCTILENAPGDNWNDNPLVLAAIEKAVQVSGLSENDAVEFAQDAQQNYCSSVSNPT